MTMYNNTINQIGPNEETSRVARYHLQMNLWLPEHYMFIIIIWWSGMCLYARTFRPTCDSAGQVG